MTEDWDTIDYWLETLTTEHSDQLNDWENNFVANMEKYADNRQEMTTAQIDKLKQIFDRYEK